MDRRMCNQFWVVKEVFETCSSVKDHRSWQRFCGMYIWLQERSWWSPYVRRTSGMLWVTKTKWAQAEQLTHDLELEVIIHALKMWKHYFIGRWFVVMSDHNGLWYLFDKPNFNSIQARWLATINEFDFEIRYIKGKENRVADALSR